jgi:hypothetical protein
MTEYLTQGSRVLKNIPWQESGDMKNGPRDQLIACSFSHALVSSLSSVFFFT